MEMFPTTCGARYNVEYCRKQIKRLESQMRYDTDPDLKLEREYYVNEEKRLNKGARKWN
jgi:hypothetical protein